jgi:flagellar hook-basal body complex protein FliE
MRIEPLKLMPVKQDMGIGSAAPAAEGQKGFGQFLNDALDKVNGLQQDSAKASVELAAGNLQDISQATIAATKASLALQLTMQIRNKVLDAYNEVMRMQV